LKFSELQQLLKQKFGIDHLADIARELGVSPQAVSNWKARDRVPYKYVIHIRERLGDGKNIISSELKNIGSRQTINIKSDRVEQGDKGYSEQSTQIGGKPLLDEEDTIYIENILLVLSKNIKLIIIIPIILSFIIFFYKEATYIPLYTSTATILLEESQNSGGLGLVASKLGLTIEKEKSDLTSTSMFPELINSRPFAERILEREFYTEKFKKNLSLLAILTYGDNKPKFGKDTLITKAADILPQMISFGNSGSFTLLSVETFEPKLAADLANAVLEELVALNRYYKYKKVVETKEFIEQRIQTVKLELEDLEEEIKIFRLSNRNYTASESLSLKFARLSRNVTIHAAMYTTLKEQLELVRIEEIQTKYLIQVLEPPIPPLGPSNLTGKQHVILSMILGIGLAIAFAFIKYYFYDQNMKVSEKMELIQGELKKNLKNMLIDRNLYILITVILFAGLPLLLGHKSIIPEYFDRYSSKVLIIIILYLFSCAISLIVVIYFNRLRSLFK